MMDSMFKVPTDTSVLKCIITKESAEGKEEPRLVTAENGQQRKIAQKKVPKKSSNEIA